MLLRILVASPARAVTRRVVAAVEAGTALVHGGSPAELPDRLESESFDVVILRCEDHADGALGLVSDVCALADGPAVIAVATREDPERRAALLEAGCLGVVWEGLEDAAFGRTLGALLARQRQQGLQRRDAATAHEHLRLRDCVSASPAMQRFLDTARRVVASDTTILLLGETGVGKEWLARAIHGESPRAGGPFVAINCGALPETLLDSELFGHQRGAFTGAARSRRGHFELAHRGTLFLDEIGDVPLHLQVKLLRALEERCIRPVGAERSIPVDVRVLAATNRNLAEEVRLQRFRSDLYYRLDVVSLTLPPLRERREDVPDLVRSYLLYFARRLCKPVRDIHPAALDAMQRYAWPGNVRELINAMERAVLMTNGTEIQCADLPEPIHGLGRPRGRADATEQRAALSALAPEWEGRTWRSVREEVLRAAERHYLIEILTDAEGRIGEAAQRAGLDPRSLFEKMRAHELCKEQFRPGTRPPQPGRRLSRAAAGAA